MARNEITVEARPERVFDVLADPRRYSDWVVGTRDIRAADPSWPAVGSRFHHTVGFGPVSVKDHVEVEESDRPRRLVLAVKARPVGRGRVSFELEPEGRGTRVTLYEQPGDGRLGRLLNLPTDILLRGRNAESLRRLKRLAEGTRQASARPR